MLTTALIILAIAVPIIVGVLYILRRKYSFTLGGTDDEDTPSGSERPRYVDENVLFTVYRPKAVAPEKWYTLLAFAHLSEKRPGAPAVAPEPADEVRRIAGRVFGGRAREQMVTQQQSGGSIPERQVLTFVPRAEGVEFNPEERQVKWLKDVHHVDFEMKGAPDSEGKTLRGNLTVYAGPFILADVPLAFQVDSVLAETSAPDELFADTSAEPYDKIFASYSHRDKAVVEQFEAHVEALGHRYLRDVYSLRSGEEWSEALKRLIEEAQVFQLFWSRNSMRSEFVRMEWEYALSLGKPSFVRPVYWEEPLPMEADLPPQELAKIHFHKFDQPNGKMVTGNKPKVINAELLPDTKDDGDVTLSHDEPNRQFLSPTVIKAAALSGFACVIFAALATGFFQPAGCVNCANPNVNSYSPPGTPTPVSVPDDPAIKNRVEAALSRAGISGVTVEVKGGVVTLKGKVPKSEWRFAVWAALESGARDVHNELSDTK